MVETICTIGLTLCISYYILSAIVGIIEYSKEKKQMTNEIWARKVKDGMKLIMEDVKVTLVILIAKFVLLICFAFPSIKIKTIDILLLIIGKKKDLNFDPREELK